MDFLSFLYLLIFKLCLVLSFERLMGVFFEKRSTSLKIMIGSYLLLFLFFSFEVFFMIIDFRLVAGIFTIIAALAHLGIPLNYESSILKRFVAAVWSYLFIQMVQGAFIVAMGIFQNATVYLNSNTALLILASGVFTYAITCFFRKFKNIKTITMKSPASWISLLIIPVFTLILWAIPLEFNLITYLPQFLVVVMSVMAIAINIFSFYFLNTISKAYEEKLKSALHAQEKEYYFAQCLLMQESVDKVKSIHHDMKLHLATARDFTASNKADEATNYINGLLGDISEVENYSDTGNIAFDSIINFKLKNAVNDNIKLDVNVSIPPALNIEVVDVVTILGNLLDNAFDAVANVEDKRIKLTIESEKGNLFITVENTFDGVIKHAKSKDKDGAEKVIATRKDGSEHGYGLKNIRKSVEKYNGHMDITHEENIFTVGILLYVDDDVQA